MTRTSLTPRSADRDPTEDTMTTIPLPDLLRSGPGQSIEIEKARLRHVEYARDAATEAGDQELARIWTIVAAEARKRGCTEEQQVAEVLHLNRRPA
jgi:hypothetical protein